MKLTQDEIFELQVLIRRELALCKRVGSGYEAEKKKIRLIELKLRDEWVLLETK